MVKKNKRIKISAASLLLICVPLLHRGASNFFCINGHINPPWVSWSRRCKEDLKRHICFFFISECFRRLPITSLSLSCPPLLRLPTAPPPDTQASLYLCKCCIINWPALAIQRRMHPQSKMHSSAGQRDADASQAHENSRSCMRRRRACVCAWLLRTRDFWIVLLLSSSSSWLLLLLFCTQHAYILSDPIIHLKLSLRRLPSQGSLLPQSWSQPGSPECIATCAFVCSS